MRPLLPAGAGYETCTAADSDLNCNPYLHNGEESIKQIDSLNKSLGAVAKETGQAPQLFHSGVSAFRRHSTVILQMYHYILDGHHWENVILANPYGCKYSEK